MADGQKMLRIFNQPAAPLWQLSRRGIPTQPPIFLNLLNLPIKTIRYP